MREEYQGVRVVSCSEVKIKGGVTNLSSTTNTKQRHQYQVIEEEEKSLPLLSGEGKSD